MMPFAVKRPSTRDGSEDSRLERSQLIARGMHKQSSQDSLKFVYCSLQDGARDMHAFFTGGERGLAPRAGSSRRRAVRTNERAMR
jgi:hypothetical protein